MGAHDRLRRQGNGEKVLRQKTGHPDKSQTQPEEGELKLRMRERGGKHNRTMKAECEKISCGIPRFQHVITHDMTSPQRITQ